MERLDLEALRKKSDEVCDSLIAAHAITSDSILITNNMREFARVPGLGVQDWVQPH